MILNGWDFVILGMVGSAAVWAVRHINKHKESGCTGDCAACGCVCNHREKGR